MCHMYMRAAAVTCTRTCVLLCHMYVRVGVSVQQPADEGAEAVGRRAHRRRVDGLRRRGQGLVGQNL